MARKRTADKQHRWLSQVEVTGVVFSEPVLAEAEPAGFPNLDKRGLARFYKAREIWNLPKGMLKDDGQSAWIRFILEEVLRLKNADDWLVGASIPAELVVRLTEQQETLRPDRVLVDDGVPVLVFLEVPRGQSLDRPWLQSVGRWKASPTTKLERLLREAKVELGLVTNGESWRLLVASPSETASWITWTANTWADSPIALAAFRNLLGEERFFAGPRENVVLELVRRSRTRQLDVADLLGEQARQALALLVHEFDRVDAEYEGSYLDGYAEREVFEAIVAFIMRLLFLLFAEENALLPHGSVAYDRSYGVLHLLTELEGQHRLSPEKLEHSYAAFARLLATSRLIHDGSVDPDIRIAAHGGRLFDSARYPLLEGRQRDGSWAWQPAAPPRISDAAVREVLRSLKYAQVDGSRQLVSYRTLAVEQIGHMYEGLLDLRVLRAPQDTALVLLEPSPKQPEPQVRWKEVDGLSEEDCITLLAKRMGRTRAQVTKALERVRRNHRGGRSDVAGLPQGHPAALLAKLRGIIRPSGRYLGLGQDRHSQGTHYTPMAVTQPMVRRLLQPLTRAPESAGKPPSLRSGRELLSLRVCDPAAGSGAFLVQATRFLADELVEAWEAAEARAPNAKLSLPFGEPAQGEPEELLMPADRDEKVLWAKRYVVEHCIYGVDINPLAVEMAKLSLWLVALSKDKPFTFLDHSIRSGNSVVGVNAAQLQAWSVNPKSTQQAMFADKAKKAMARAAKLRRQVWALPPAEAEHQKAQVLQRSALATREARVAADLLVSAWMGEGDRDESIGVQARDQLRLASADSMEAWAELEGVANERLGTERPFHWAIEYPEVFVDGAGFDAVIGNPPYVRQEMLRNIKRYLQEAYEVYVGTADLYTYFYELALRLIRPGGRFSMIVTNKWMKAAYGAGLRKVLTSEAWIESIVDFGHAKQIFRGVDVFPCILTAVRPSEEARPDQIAACVIAREDLNLSNLYQQWREETFMVPRNAIGSGPWHLEPSAVIRLMEKITQRGEPLSKYSGRSPMYGIKPGLIAAYVVDSATRSALVSQDPEAATLFRKFIRGRDVKRWRATWGGEWMLLLASSANHKWPWSQAGADAEATFARTHPSVYRHMKGFEDKLRKRSDQGAFWWELRSCDYYSDFDRPKLIYQDIQFSPAYALDRAGLVMNTTVNFIPGDDSWLAAVLCSPILWWYNWRHLAHGKDDALRPKGYKMDAVPIVSPSALQREQCEELLGRISQAKVRQAECAQAVLDLTHELLPGFRPTRRLFEPFVLSEQRYLADVTKCAERKPTRSEQNDLVRVLQHNGAAFAQSAQTIAESETTLFQLVERAFGLTDAESGLIWATAPPRMPTSNPNAP